MIADKSIEGMENSIRVKVKVAAWNNPGNRLLNKKAALPRYSHMRILRGRRKYP